MNSLATLSAAQLRRAADLKERIEQLQGELDELIGNQPAIIITSKQATKKKRTVSAAAKAKMAKSQKERWAKIKAEKKA